MSTQSSTELVQSKKSEKIVSCPSCKGERVYGEANKFRPFCSARCQKIDLGAWASEEFTIPSNPPSIDTPMG